MKEKVTITEAQLKAPYKSAFNESILNKDRDIIIDAYAFKKATKEIEITEKTVKRIAPKAEFVFKGVDTEYVYFHVVAKHNQIDASEIDQLKHKTRFVPIEEETASIYIGSFKVSYI